MSRASGLARMWGAAALAGVATAAGWTGRALWHGDGDQRELELLEDHFWVQVRTQLEVARRYERRFTLTSTELDVADATDVDATDLVFSCAGGVRSLDAVALIDQRLVVLWWNSDREQAASAVARLVADGLLPASALTVTNAAVFPGDGLTAVSLVEAAADRHRRLEPGRSLRVVPDTPQEAPRSSREQHERLERHEAVAP